MNEYRCFVYRTPDLLKTAVKVKGEMSSLSLIKIWENDAAKAKQKFLSCVKEGILLGFYKEGVSG